MHRNILSGTILSVLVMALLMAMPVTGSADTTVQPSGETEEVTVETIDALMKDRTVENSQAAIRGLEKLLKRDPENSQLLVKIANAYITIIDIKTAALIEEKDEYKPILEEMGKKAYDYAYKAYKKNPKFREAVGAALVAYGYYSASFGIIKAVFKGAAGHYKDLARELNAIDQHFEAALGYRSLGKLYEVAPWPVGSSRKALDCFRKAVALSPGSLYSQYYLGLLLYKKDKYEPAEKAFLKVVNDPPDPSETHFIQAYRHQAKIYLDKIARKKK